MWEKQDGFGTIARKVQVELEAGWTGREKGHESIAKRGG